MTAINPVTDLSLDGEIAVITLNYPPVNALSRQVRLGLQEAFRAVAADPRAKAVVLICEGRTFIAGADITEMGKPGGNTPPLSELALDIEGCPKPAVAAIHGTALGGGLECALLCHYRVAVPSARVGLPEVTLGLLPGGGGTQRLPRVVGVQKALEVITSGEQIKAGDALAMGLVDEVVEEGRLREGALAFARRIVAENRPVRRIRDQNEKLEAVRSQPGIFDEFRKANARRFRGALAPEYIIRCIEAAVTLPFDKGLAVEKELFVELQEGPQSAAMRYAFFAERTAAKIPDLADIATRPIASVGIVGAGTMGGGIAMAFANAGLPVTLVDTSQEALDRGLGVVRRNYERTAARGGLGAAQLEERFSRITGALKLEDLAQADLIIEAVFERMDVKLDVFRRLDAIAKPGAILASNTSYLDIDEIARTTSRPDSVLGLHFFSPANVMRLLEIVRGARTSPEVAATAMQLAKKIGKVGVLVGVTYGFVGNRMLARRQEEAQALLLEGVLPWDVDRVLYDFGFPMGPFAMADLAGLDVGWDKAASRGERIRDLLCEMGRLGQKSGAGFYDYDEARNARPSPVTEQVVRDFVAKAGGTPREVDDQEILGRCLYPVVNEGAKLLAEGIALRASDIDVIWLYGYGWPIYRGGPMHWADQLGLDKVAGGLKDLQARYGDRFAPAPLLASLAAEGKKFADPR